MAVPLPPPWKILSFRAIPPQALDLTAAGPTAILKPLPGDSFFRLRGVAQFGLECLTGGQEVAGSNPVAPISIYEDL